MSTPNNENQTPITPVQQQVNDSSFLTCQPQQENFKDLDNDELQVLISLAINTLHEMFYFPV